MSNWNSIVLVLFGITYIPFFWFLGMRSSAREILNRNNLYDTDPVALLPAWARTGTQLFLYAHYCFFLVPLTLLSWLHGLAAFGAGVLLFVFLPLLSRSYSGIFKRNALRVYKKDRHTGKQLIRILKVAGG